MAVYAERLGPNDCKTISIGDRQILVVSEGQVEVNVGDSGAYIHQRSNGKSIGLYEVDGPGGGYNTVAEVEGGDEWFAGFDVDWQNGQTPQGNFSDNLLVVSASDGSFSRPVFSSNSAYDHLTGSTDEIDKELTSSIDSDIADSYCRGDSGSVRIRVSNESICKAIDASLDITYELTGETESINLTNDFTETNKLKRLNSKEEEITFTIPDNTSLGERDILTVDVNSSDAVNQLPTYTFSSRIGNQASDLSLQSISDTDGVCGGDSISKDVIVENSGSCSSSVELLVANSFDDNIISTDALSVQPATAEPSTGSFSLRFDAPSGSSGQDITYTANLLYAGESVASEQFTVSVDTGNVQLDNVDAPSRACPSDEIRFSIDVLNQGSCDARASAQVTNDVNDEVLTSSTETIRGGSGRGYRFEDTIPSNLSGGITYDAIIQSIDGTTLASETFTVAVGSKDISLSNLEFDDSICVGKEVDWSVEASNGGECDADVTLGIQKQGQESIDILGTENARSGSSATFRESITVPASDLDSGQNQYTIYALIDEPDGLVPTDTLTHTATLQDSDISLVGTSFPNARCVGDNIVGTFNIANNGNCDGQYRVLVTDSITGNEVEVETDDIRGNRRTSVTFEDTMPAQALESGSISYDYQLQTLRPDGFTTIGTGSETVNVEPKNTNITEVDAPTEACVGSEITSTVVLRNDSRCDAQYRIIADKPLRPGTEVIDESSIPSNTNKNIQIDDVIPSEAISQSALAYGVSVEVRQIEGGVYEEVDSASFNISILQSDVQLDAVSSPSEACVTSQPEISVDISNAGDCASEYRIGYERVNDGKAEIIRTGNIPSGQKASASFQDEIISSLSEEDSLTYEIVCEKRFNENQEWQVVGTSTTSISVLTPTIQLASAQYPEFDTPGDKQYQIEITNESQCSTSLDISISGSTMTEEISAGGSITLNDSFTLKGFDVVRDITIFDNSVQDIVFEQSFTVKPHNFVAVNQSEGEVKMVGGFSEEVGYTGNIIATGVVGENLEETDRVAGVVGLNRFAGTMTTDSDDEDIIRFGALKGFNIVLQESAFIILDGEIKGKSRTYNHSTISTSALGVDEEAGIQTISGPLSNFGTLAQKVGFRPGILSPKISRDR